MMDIANFNSYVEEKKVARELGLPAESVCIVGSTLICGAGNDVDFICLVASEDILEKQGFTPDVDATYESPLRSFRREGQNVIATTDPRFYFAEVAIAHAARLIATDKFDMSNRDERIRFHSGVRGHVLARMAEGF